MKKPSEQEIKDKYESMLKENNTYTPWDALNVGINFMFQYNLEQRDVIKVYDIGYEVDMVEILNILEQDNHLWDEYAPSIFEGINWVHDMGDELEFSISLRSEYGLHDEILIFIDDKARVTIGLGDTPWEGSGVEDEIPEAIMSYVTKQKYK